MFTNYSLRFKLTMSLLGIVMIAIICLVVVQNFSTRKMARDEAFGKAEAITKYYAKSVKEDLEVAITTAKVMASAFKGLKSNNTTSRKLCNQMLYSTISSLPNIQSIWTCWEPLSFDGDNDDSYIDSKGHDKTGRFIPCHTRDKKGNILLEPRSDYTEKGSGYELAKNIDTEILTEPYRYNTGGQEILVTSAIVPLIHDDKFVGVVGVDVPIERFQSLVAMIRPYETGWASLISTKGTIVAHLDTSWIGKDFIEQTKQKSRAEFFKNIEKSEIISEIETDPQFKKKIVRQYAPIRIGSSKQTWALNINIPEDKILAMPKKMLITSVFIGTCICLFALIISLFISKAIVKPIYKSIYIANTVAQGDLSVEIRVTSQDETGQMLLAMKNMVLKLHDIMQKLIDSSNSLSSSSSELSAVSQITVSSVKEMDEKTESVTAASAQISKNVKVNALAAEQSGSSALNISNMTEKMSATLNNIVKSSQKTFENVKSVAESSEKLSFGINQVAVSIEEMTGSLNEVAKNTTKANQTSQNASQRTTIIDSKFKALSDASKQIGKMVGMIKNIADKTDMLALNATIEAAGAGEAGKGFAVVASEVKELAKKSTEATEEITSQIQQIQNSTNDAIASIHEISIIINDIAANNQMIASAVEEQTSTANEIAKTIVQNANEVKDIANRANESSDLVNESVRSIEDTSKTASEVAKYVQGLVNAINNVTISTNESSKGIQNISKNMQDISHISKNTASGANKTSMLAIELTKIASVLYEIIKRFKLSP